MFAKILIFIIALLHVYILILEMFLWDKPAGRKAFGHTAEQAKVSKTLAQNMGLYNGFLAAGLFWSLVAGSILSFPVANFFLACVFIAGGIWRCNSKSENYFYSGCTCVACINFIEYWALTAKLRSSLDCDG